MTTPKTIDDILRELCSEAEDYMGDAIVRPKAMDYEAIKNEAILHAKKQIGKLLPKHDNRIESDNPDEINFAYGYNSCLDDIKRMLE